MERNALTEAKLLVEKEEWVEAYKICAEYLEAEDNEIWAFLDEQESIELILLKINCVIRSIPLFDLFSHIDEEENLLVWKDEHDSIVEMLRDSIFDLPAYILMAGTEDESKSKEMIEELYVKVDYITQQHCLYMLDGMINSIPSVEKGNEAFNRYCAYSLGFNCLCQIILIDFMELADTLDLEDVKFNGRYHREARNIMSDKLFDRVIEITNEISESTMEFPYFSDYDVAYMYIMADGLIDQILPYYDENDPKEKAKRILRLKHKINLNCDFLNAIYVTQGHRTSLCMDVAARESRYEKILKYEKEIQETEHDYSHPPVNKEKFSTLPEENKSGGCYVATAVYGSYDCPQVWTLRRYRDNILAKTMYGRMFIRTYYAISPTLVKWFGNTQWFKKMWQGKLDKMVSELKSRGIESTPYEDRKW